MDVFNFNPLELMSFILTLIRISLVVFLLPFFGGDTIPAQVKAALCIVLTLAVWPRLSFPGALFPAHPGDMLLLILGEMILGMLLGLMVHFTFAAMQIGGQLIGFQMGFSMITLGDPSSGQQLIVTAFLANFIAMAIFLTMDGHLYLLSALSGSFKLIQPGSLFITSRSVSDVIAFSGVMFTLALKIAGPIVACLFMVDLALALMAKAAPQMNLLMVGFPIKIGVGFFFFGIMFSLMSLYLDDFIRTLGPMFNNLMRTLQPGA